jgi:hypothetical protein
VNVGVKRAILRRTIQHSNDDQYLRMYALHDAEREKWKYEYMRVSGRSWRVCEDIGESVIEIEIIRAGKVDLMMTFGILSRYTTTG